MADIGYSFWYLFKDEHQHFNQLAFGLQVASFGFWVDWLKWDFAASMLREFGFKDYIELFQLNQEVVLSKL